MFGVNERTRAMEAMPICAWAIEENSNAYRYEHNRTACLIQ
jgi:hypothetical protein